MGLTCERRDTPEQTGFAFRGGWRRQQPSWFYAGSALPCSHTLRMWETQICMQKFKSPSCPAPGGAAPSRLQLLFPVPPPAAPSQGHKIRQPRGQGTHVEEGAPSFALCSAASPSNGSSDKRRQRARTYRIKRLGSQELLELLELLLVLVQDVPLLLGQGTQAGAAARGAGQGTSAQPVLALRTSGFPPSLPVLSFCWRGQGCPRELPVLTCSGWWRAARSAARSPASEAGRPELRSGSPGSR